MRKTLLRSIVFIALVTGVISLAFNASANNAGDAKQQIQAARAALKDAKHTLGETMDCCMEPACDFCALAIEKCPCGANIKAGKPICGNCADGWEAGRGDVPNIDKSKIKRYTPEIAKMMFDKRYAK